MIWVVLNSYNRPRGLKRALSSLTGQRDCNWTCLLMDDGSDFDVASLCADPRVRLFHASPTPQDRAEQVRYALAINEALDEIVGVADPGDPLCYLCDDDWFYPNWFEDLHAFFGRSPGVKVCYGREMALDFSQVGDPTAAGPVRFFPDGIRTPGGYLDHCQVSHRVECVKTLRWPLVFPADWHFFNLLHHRWEFYPLAVFAAQKAYHPKALNTEGVWADRYQKGLSGWRE